MPFSRRGNGMRIIFKHLKPKKIKKLPVIIPNNKRIRANSSDISIVKTKTQVRELKFASNRKNEVVEDRIDRKTGNLKMPCWLTGGCDD